MSGRSKLVTRDAEAIAGKIASEVEERRGHAIAKIRVGGRHICQFGIRRGTSVGHDYIPRQINVSMRQALELARCTMYRDDYERILAERGLIPPVQTSES